MDGKIKVYNPTTHDVGVYLVDSPTAGRNIRPGTFIYMTEADIDMLMATTGLFAHGHLRVEEAAEDLMTQNGIDVKDNPNFMDDDEIRKKLSMSAKKISEWLDTIEVDHVLGHVYEVAMTMDLPKTKLAALKAKMPDNEFI